MRLSLEEIYRQPKILLTKDEMQTLIDRDQDCKIMDDACRSMNVSKTVYAGIYASARHKIVQSIVEGAVLMIECQA